MPPGPGEEGSFILSSLAFSIPERSSRPNPAPGKPARPWMHLAGDWGLPGEGDGDVAW